VTRSAHLFYNIVTDGRPHFTVESPFRDIFVKGNYTFPVTGRRMLANWLFEEFKELLREELEPSFKYPKNKD
jgi:hypothetical protein